MKCLTVATEFIKIVEIYISYNKKLQQEMNFCDTRKNFICKVCFFFLHKFLLDFIAIFLQTNYNVVNFNPSTPSVQ